MKLRLSILLSFSVVLPSTAFAVGTEVWKLQSSDDFRAGKLERVIVSSTGEVSLGRAVTRASLEGANLAWSMARDASGAVYVGGGPKGTVYRVKNPGDDKPTVEKLFETGQLLVSSLAVDGQGNVFAGTIPNGKIFRYDAGTQKSAELVTLTSKYVWALALGDGGKVHAATGPDGKLWTIDGGKATELYASREKHLFSLARDPSGDLYVGAAPKAIVFKVSPGGKASVVHAFDGDEVRALALHKGQLFAAVNGIKGRLPLGTTLFGVQPAAQPAQQNQQPAGGPAPAPQPGQQPAAAQPPGGAAPPISFGPTPLGEGSLYRIAQSGRVERLLHLPRGYVTSVGVDDQGNAYAGSGAEARVYRVSPSREVAVVLDFEEKQVLSLLVQGNGAMTLGTGNGGALYSSSDKQADKGSFISRVLDCRFPSRWGKVGWLASGEVKLLSRSGQTEAPDATWSDWTAASGSNPGKLESVGGRYLQLKVEFGSDKAAVLRELATYYLQQNQRPRLTSVTVGDAPAGGSGGGGNAGPPNSPMASLFTMGARMGGPRMNMIGMMGGRPAMSGPGNPNGPSKDTPASPPQTAPAQPSRLPVHTVSRRINWSVENPDGDDLSYWVWVKEQSATAWILLNPKDAVSGTGFSWNTESFPDGHYVVKVKVSDERSNPKTLALTHERISTPVLVDNRKPEVVDLAVDDKTLEVRGLAKDSFSAIRRIQYSVDGGEWLLVHPEDEILDDKEEKFRFTIDPKPAAGAHTLSVRAYDSDGNIGTASLVFNVQ